MAVSGIFGWLNIRGLSASIEIPEEIYDTTETLVSLRLKNRRTFPACFLTKVKVLGTEVCFTMVKRGEEEDGGALVTVKARGPVPLGEVRLESGFPINFFVRSKKYRIGESFTVFPRPIPCPDAVVGEGDRSTDETAPFQKSFQGEVSRIRDYTGAEPLKLVHWRISARDGNLKVKDLAGGGLQPVIIEVERLPGSNLESALSCGAYLVNSLIRGNRPVGLKVGSRLINPETSRAHRLKLLRELAVYGKC